MSSEESEVLTPAQACSRAARQVANHPRHGRRPAPAAGAVPGVAPCLHPARIRQLVASVDGRRGLPGLGPRETIVSEPAIAHRCVTHLLATNKTYIQGTLAEVETIVSKPAALCNRLAQAAVLGTVGALGGHNSSWLNPC